jgi:hypothetical protein
MGAFSRIRRGSVRGNDRKIVNDRVRAEMLALNNLKLGNSFQHAGFIMIAGLANTGILDRISHGIHPFNRHHFRDFFIAKDVPIVGQRQNKYLI